MREDKLPPHSIETEEAVLGALLVDSSAIAMVAGSLKVGDFYREKNVWVYQACLTLYDRNEAVDQVTVAHELSRVGKLDPCGGAAYLSHLIAGCATSVHIEYYASILVRLASQRALLTASVQIEALADIEDVEKSFGDAVGILLQLKRESKKEYVMSPKEQAEYATERYSEKMYSTDESTIDFGLPCIDKLGGMDNGDIGIITGPPGEGKTTLAKQFADYISKRYGNALFVSLEMSKGQITDRDIARLTGEYIVKIRRGHYTEDTYNKICSVFGPLSEGKLYYYYPPVGTVPLIYAAARKLQIQHGLTLVVVDYIQLLNDTEGGRGENERLTNISRGIKSMARELEVPVLVVSRINRSKDGSNLDRTYGSGALSYDPDWSFLLEREKDESGHYTDLCNLTITKQRQGGIKDVEQKLIFDYKTQSFHEVTK